MAWDISDVWKRRMGIIFDSKSLDIFDINLNVSRLFSCLIHLSYIKMRMGNKMR